MSRSIAAVVLCAGKGTRMKSARAKVLHEILGKPLAYYPLRRAFELGASPVVSVLGHQADEVEKALGEVLPGQPLEAALQAEQLGTAHAVLCAKKKLKGFDGEIVILYGDVPLVRTETLKALIKARRQSGSPVGLITTRPANPHGYGRIVRQGGKVSAIVEEKDCTPEQRAIGEVNAGLYVVEAAFLWKALERVGKKNSQREFYLTDLAELAFAAGTPAASVEADFAEVAGVNDRAQLAQAAAAMRQRINEAHMLAGVTFEDPATTFIDEGVRIGPDARIGPFCQLRGTTRVGSGARLGAGCVLTDSEVGEGVDLKPYCVLEQAKADKGCLIGPFARLRPGTELSQGVHIGNFVETKKARIGQGSKANHLTYLGDCTIGRGVNVGAGTITCNYDGVHKHPTVLGDGVFVGSDTQFVAPCTVGKGAYIGAGSTIVEDVPPYSLAIARGRQVTKVGYVKKKRAQG